MSLYPTLKAHLKNFSISGSFLDVEQVGAALRAIENLEGSVEIWKTACRSWAHSAQVAADRADKMEAEADELRARVVFLEQVFKQCITENPDDMVARGFAVRRLLAINTHAANALGVEYIEGKDDGC